MPATVLFNMVPEDLPHSTLRNNVFTSLATLNILPLFQKMERSNIKAHKQKASCFFLRDCIEEQVIPHCMSKGTMTYSTLGHPFPPHLKAAIRHQYHYELQHKEDKFASARDAKRDFLRACPEQCPPGVMPSCSTAMSSLLNNINYWVWISLSKQSGNTSLRSPQAISNSYTGT